MGKGNVFITGDTHRDFTRIKSFCEKYETTLDDTIIILGDVGINYFLDIEDVRLKYRLSKMKINLFCVKGNHEKYPAKINTYREIDYRGGKAYIEPEFTNLIFAKDGEIYDFNIGGENKKAIVIGGAYSVDKPIRLRKGLKWFSDEQPSEEVKEYVENQLDKVNWGVDYIFSHTCPFRYTPTEWLKTGLDQTKVDKSTEEWLDKIYEKLDFDKWYCGHYHGEKVIDRIEFMYKGIKQLR